MNWVGGLENTFISSSWVSDNSDDVCNDYKIWKWQMKMVVMEWQNWQLLEANDFYHDLFFMFYISVYQTKLGPEFTIGLIDVNNDITMQSGSLNVSKVKVNLIVEIFLLLSNCRW